MPAEIHPAPFAATLPPAKPRKLLHLQILRAVAASMVVINHSVGALINGKQLGAAYSMPADLTGNTGVVAFFVLSGLIMTRQSADKFGSARNSFDFMLNRIIRIVPLYWLATIAWLVQLMAWGIYTPHTARQLLLSLSFFPDYLAANGYMQPILRAGWTLDFEMFFYLLFALCLLVPRRFGVPALLVALYGLTLLGARYAHPHSVFAFYANSFILLFGAGVVIAATELKIPRLPNINLLVSPAFLLLLVPAFGLGIPGRFHAPMLWLYIRWFGLGVVLLCTFARLDRPGWINRTLILLGDASYSTYLVHQWAISAVMEHGLRRHAGFDPTGRRLWLFVLPCMVAANLLGLLVHFTVERPVTRFIKSRMGRKRQPTPIAVVPA
jgi:exopolysaccharide production protein ExoZ